ncbi:ribonuclease III family protein [Cylindrospermum sp. FACHB-282]|uniref:ribonuclease III family protein n=1 Tax=Cylindrospermum sp. FACHB-282 TaxID=2692794 RepID=UPI001687B135|nr:ribonuclease III domain-containing protein [Cylindrospermum sp. FACHB-282]MBD2385797.1 ribonuclease III [Cylindrospermum sp. FACHB-282]
MNDRELSQWIQIKFGIVPQELSKYRRAITTRQYEVLEFFGDSILGFLVSEYLIKHYSVDQPGWFTQVRSQLVEDKNLALIAQQINLSSIVIIPSTSIRQQITDRVLADILEALIGAIYLDQGLDKCREIVSKLLDFNKIRNPYTTNNYNHVETSSLNIENPISTLQELLAKYGISPPDYFDIEQKGQAHTPIFTIRASCNFRGKYLKADGIGRSKKEAKKDASEKLLLLVLKCQ